MTWFLRGVALIILCVIAVAIYAVTTAYRSPNPVGFQVARVESPSGPVAVAVWYPTKQTPRPTTFIGASLMSVARDGAIEGTGLPLIVLSHGNGGSGLSHVDLAMALASAGYVVAAPTHAGDNYADASRQSSPTLFSERAGQLRATIDYMLGKWGGARQIDNRRIGAYGMSAGAFTVLTLAGGQPRMDVIPRHCRTSPEFICSALRQTRSPLLENGANAGDFTADARVKAASIAAPGLGFTFEGGLGQVNVPIQGWWGDRDDIVPYATNAKVIADGLGRRATFHRVQGARHTSFLAPCRLLRPAALCADVDGFDREAAHARMNAAIIRFFDAALTAPRR